MTATPRDGPSTRPGRALFIATFVLLSAAAIRPVLRSAYLPLVDLPEHASQVALWRAWPHDPELQRLYTLHPTSPYAGFYWLWRSLAACGLSIERAGNLLVALCLVLVPLGLLALLRARRRPVAWALLAFPFAYTKTLAWGMVPFYFTYALLFFALALFAMWLRRGSAAWALAVAASGALLMWEHPLIAGFWGLSCGLLTILDRQSLAAKAWALLPLLPAGLLLVLYAAGSSNHGVLAPDFQASAWDWAGAFFLSVYDGTTEAVTATIGLMQPVLALIVLAGVAAVLLPQRHAPASALKAVTEAFDRPLLATAALAFLLYLFLPFTMFATAFVNMRFAAIALLLVIAALPPIPWRWVRGGLLAATAMVALLTDAAVADAYATFNRAIGDMPSALAALPAKASVAAPLNAPHNLPPLEIEVLHHIEVWGQLRTLGLAPAFTDREHMLVRDAVATDGPRFDPRLETGADGHPEIVASPGRLPDALLFYSPETPASRLPIRGSAQAYRLVRQTGGMVVYLKVTDR